MLLLTSWDNEDKIDFIVHELNDLLSWFINNNDLAVIFIEEDNSTIADIVLIVEDGSFDDDIDRSDIETDFLSDSLSEMFIINRVLDGDDDGKDILYLDGNRRVEDFVEP